ncbi:MAG: hypothetical protein A2940_00910 [Candidatus Wildermuthbacteria bacterium RIFCSPLOWO2_01_FULL_48_29]|uniref:Transcriptional repressor PaaX-like central Cas2-like domain-containing protein n=2 Tax=Candidatus Wildermuthiibacteriota TaxID=1817923 RepID=A0A1G2RKA7_9BACT|nr:MAG: Repressor in ring oxydation complex/ phenylacetic acid degradation pathway related protein (PaaX) [Parcubacteria group bacterium GW2011_GWA1_54_9]OHA63881.1 MAG: hypothetical protein A2843_01015 [Candidatus Wildermuthbacteria bacterium RIFCSPHIGHO2_01_FULL_48_27b]OHA73273.1 MAG: hypothetical protein A2940_00910 [Candidatus Wildermuthbacteria bacterium RIFCSPLOWO2_01_FULL_48_29]
MQKYKYSLRKPRSEIVKDILNVLLVSGVIVLAATSPYAGIVLWKSFQKKKQYAKRMFSNTFHGMKHRGLIAAERRGHEVRIVLTSKGKEAAAALQITQLAIKKQKKWDGFWRIVCFDISELRRFERNAFRGMLKQLGFVHLQKSVWIQPFPCIKEIEAIRGFFNLTEREVRLIETRSIGSDDFLGKKFFL